ncbi:MAG: hypothetical protein HC843_01335 [Sphingomonadales bacterium]|nr:hypothetical protein [Sphingomonadales bacterium]
MRPIAKLTLLSPLATALATAAALSFTTPIYAQNVIFVPGTGDADAAHYASDSDTYEDIAPIPNSNSEARLRDVAAKLNDPAMQDGIANMAKNLGNVMMQLPVGTFIHAIEKARPGIVDRRYDEDMTLADMAGPEGENLPAEIGAQSRTAVQMMGGFADALAGFMPQLEQMGRALEKSMADIRAKNR